MNIGNTNLETRLQCHDPINSNFIYYVTAIIVVVVVVVATVIVFSQ